MSNRPLLGPVSWLTRRGRHLWLRSGWLILVCMAIAIVAGANAGLPVAPPTVPVGVALEMTGTADGALGTLRALDDAGTLPLAAPAIYWDFLFILGYSFGLATFLDRLDRNAGQRADPLAAYAAWGALLAGACDVVENLSMLRLLSQYEYPHPSLGLPALIGTLASLSKWTVISAVVGYTVWEIAKACARFYFSPRSGSTPQPVPVAPVQAGGSEQQEGELQPATGYNEVVFEPGEGLSAARASQGEAGV